MSLSCFRWREHSVAEMAASIKSVVDTFKAVHIYIGKDYVNVSLKLNADDPNYVCSFYARTSTHAHIESVLESALQSEEM